MKYEGKSCLQEDIASVIVVMAVHWLWQISYSNLAESLYRDIECITVVIARHCLCHSCFGCTLDLANFV